MPCEEGSCPAAASPLRPVLGSLAFLAAVEASWQLHERCASPHLPKYTNPYRHELPLQVQQGAAFAAATSDSCPCKTLDLCTSCLTIINVQ